MATWQTPKTDWNTSNYFNYSDFNRIESNVIVIATLLQYYGYNLTLTTITNRSDGLFLDFYDSLNRIEQNILALYNCLKIAPDGWLTPFTSWIYGLPFSYVDTNRMENDELVLYNMINGNLQQYTYCGQDLNICGLGWYN